MLNKILYSDNGTISDISADLRDYRSGTSSVTLKTTDALYIGQRAPFNHLYFKASAYNTTAANLTVKIWDGDEFVAVAELIDETISSGAPFGQDGFLTWTPDRDLSGWAEDDTDDMSGSDIVGLKIYDRYWLQITTDTLLEAVTFDWIGQKFSNDNDLYGEFPVFNKTNMKIAFESGKTDWTEQHVFASRILAQDLIKKGIITHQGQILERDDFTMANIQKTAEIIFNAFGDDYVDDREKARNEYQSRLDKGIFKVDKNANADLDKREHVTRAGFLSR